MNSPSSPAQPPAPRPEDYALRFGINDLLCIPALFGLHMGVGMVLLGNPQDTERVIACAVLSATLTFATAYLTYRLTTTRRIEDFGTRVTWLVMIEFLLVVFIPFGMVLVAAGASTCPWLLVVALGFYLGYRMGQANPPKKQATSPRTFRSHNQITISGQEPVWIVNGSGKLPSETRNSDEEGAITD